VNRRIRIGYSKKYGYIRSCPRRTDRVTRLARTRRSDWSLHYTRERKLVRGFWNSVKRSTTQHSTSQTLQGQKVKGQDKTGHAGPIANGSPAKKFGDLIILEFLYFYISIFRISFIFNLCSLRIFFSAKFVSVRRKISTSKYRNLKQKIVDDIDTDTETIISIAVKYHQYWFLSVTVVMQMPSLTIICSTLNRSYCPEKLECVWPEH